MLKRRAEREPLSKEDAAFVGRLSESYRPEAMSPARQSAFDQELHERLRARGRARAFGLGSAAAALVAALALWYVVPTPAPAPSKLSAEVREWESTLLYLDELEAWDDTESLPDDYLAIDLVFLGNT